LKVEKVKNFTNTKVRNEADFKNMLKDLKIGCIEVIENEVICGAKNTKTNNILLLYGIFNNNGKLDVTVKSNDDNDVNNVFAFIQSKYCWNKKWDLKNLNR